MTVLAAAAAAAAAAARYKATLLELTKRTHVEASAMNLTSAFSVSRVNAWGKNAS